MGIGFSRDGLFKLAPEGATSIPISGKLTAQDLFITVRCDMHPKKQIKLWRVFEDGHDSKRLVLQACQAGMGRNEKGKPKRCQAMPKPNMADMKEYGLTSTISPTCLGKAFAALVSPTFSPVLFVDVQHFLPPPAGQEAGTRC